MKKDKQPRVVVGALIEQNGKYLLVKEVLEDNREYWIIPGGGVDFGESLEEAIKREIKEETGLDIEIIRYIQHKEAIFPEYNYHTIIFLFLAKPLNKNLIFEDKILEGGFLTKKEIKKIKLVDSAVWFLRDFGILK